jgi:NAD(P)-dependent dehydrogenase (short-subunit alcohol dehydrogenase family)
MSRPGALVTGSARGIGRRIALALARQGYDVAIHYRTSHDDAEATRAEIESLGARAVALEADLRDLEAGAALVREAHDRLGSLTVLVNNVGNYVYTAFEELTLEQWRDVLATNLDATFATCRAALPIMREAARGGS